MTAMERLHAVGNALGLRLTEREWLALEIAVEEHADAQLDIERAACAKLVHDRLGADGYGVAKMILARGEQR
jgi:hypothetical protein